jgi:hypothetical protein
MGDCHLFHDEIRISVRDPEKTELWVYIRGEGDCPFQCLGWHYKAFPSTITSHEVLQRWAEGLENPLGWERQNPPQTELNYELPDYETLIEEMIKKGKTIN